MIHYVNVYDLPQNERKIIIERTKQMWNDYYKRKKIMRASRDEVYAAIDGERDYQDSKWGNSRHSVLEFLVYMRDYCEEAMHLCSRNSDATIGTAALDCVRKITALGVVCMEQNGVAER